MSMLMLCVVKEKSQMLNNLIEDVLVVEVRAMRLEDGTG